MTVNVEDSLIPDQIQIKSNENENRSISTKCSFCYKKTDDLIGCKYCSELFCKDHLEAKTPSDFLRTKGGHSCKEYAEVQKSKQETEPLIENKEENIPYMSIDTNEPNKDKKRSLIVTASLLIIFILLVVASVGGYLILKQQYSNFTDEKRYLESELFLTNNDIEDAGSQLNITTEQLGEINSNLQNNITKNNLQKTGDKYNLHDPLSNDVTQFIENDKSSDIKTEIENAKEQGIRCALVEVRMTSASGGLYQLIGFNTIDEGMVYYEPVTDYRVFLIIGRSYVDCVQGSPYSTSFDDTVTDILVIW